MCVRARLVSESIEVRECEREERAEEASSSAGGEQTFEVETGLESELRARAGVQYTADVSVLGAGPNS